MKLKGFFPATFTPFHPDGQINTGIIPMYAEHLKKNDISGVFINGTTSEGLLLTLAERKGIAEAWMRHRSDNFRVIVHVGATSIEDAKDLARHAASLSADAISAMAPMFLKPQSVLALIDFCAGISQVAPDLPFYYYHIPQVTAVDFMIIDFLEQAGDRIPGLTGIKYSGTNIMDVLLCAEYKNQAMDIVYGQDEKLLAGLAFGLEGAIGSTYNYMAPHYHALVEAYRSGNMEKARSLQLESAKIVRCMDHFGGGIRVGKRIMAENGIDCGGLRSPGVTMSQKDWELFRTTLQELGLDELDGVAQLFSR